MFLTSVTSNGRRILSYPIFRRFYFDGQISGRFEFGFRLNEGSLFDIQRIAAACSTIVSYDALALSRQVFSEEIAVKLLDGRVIFTKFQGATNALRDAYLESSTRNDKIHQYPIADVGSQYVAVGPPFIFVRAGTETPLIKINDARILNSQRFIMLGARSGSADRSIDTIIIASSSPLDLETEAERFARLFYTQLRALTFAHSFYIRQVDSGAIVGASSLEPAIKSMLSRLKGLTPLVNDQRDAEVCAAMANIVEKSDLNPARLAHEIDMRLKRRGFSRLLGKFFPYFDKKIDLVVETIASTITKHVLGGGL